MQIRDLRLVPLRRSLAAHPARRLLLLAIPILVPLLVGIDLYVVVTSRFDRRRVSVPSRIFSDRMVLAPTLRYPKSLLLAKLRRLGYRGGDDASAPGVYRELADDAKGGALEIHLRGFDDPLFPCARERVLVRWSRDAIRDLRRVADDEPLPAAVIEPEVIGSVYDRHMEDRTLVAMDEISPTLVASILAVEDREFRRHGGINPKGVLRAFVANLRGRKEGGSTLTMQLVKNLYLSPERTVRRKLVEALLALILDARYDKDEILTAYMNEIYLGQRGAVSITGVQEAARYYFGADAKTLTPAEAALLAGMIRSPGTYDPWRHPKRAEARRQTVLEILQGEGILSAEAAAVAAAQPLTTLEARPRPFTASFFVDHVLSEIDDRLATLGRSRDELGRGGMRVFTTLDTDIQIQAESALTGGLEELEKGYARLRSGKGRHPLEAAMVALAPASGYIRAMVGGRDHAKSEFNRVTQAKRQPGSLFKPFIYLSGFEKPADQALRATDLVDDSPITVTWEDGSVQWSPRNYDGEFRGPVTLREALEKSLNIPAVRTALRVGLPDVVRTARACGIRSRLVGYPSMALGSFEISPLEIAFAYSALAAGGLRPSAPTAILAVVDGDGRVLDRAERPLIRAASPQAAYLVDSLLRGVLDRGTGGSARRLGVRGPMAGKTGTTNDYHDAWFVGFSPKILAAVWVGFDDERHVGLSGNKAALPIWANWVKDLPPSLTEVEFSRPEGIVERHVDPRSGGLATENCPSSRLEVYRVGTEPTESCRLHDSRMPFWRFGPEA